MQQGMGVTTTYNTFISKLDVDIQSLLENLRVSKRANGGGGVTWADMVAIYRDQLSGVALVPTSTMGGGSNTLSKNSTPRGMRVSSSSGVGLVASVN